MQLQCNVGEKDSKIRLIGGVIAAIFAISSQSLILAIIAAALLFSGWKRSCMLYSLLKIDTNKKA
jgi:hypothetical protein